MIEALRDIARHGGFRGTATDLLAKLDERDRPANPRALSCALRRLEGELQEVGVEVRRNREPGGSRTRVLEVRKVDDRSSAPDLLVLAGRRGTRAEIAAMPACPRCGTRTVVFDEFEGEWRCLNGHKTGMTTTPSPGSDPLFAVS